MDFYADPEYILSPWLSQPDLIGIPYTSLQTTGTSDSNYPPHQSRQFTTMFCECETSKSEVDQISKKRLCIHSPTTEIPFVLATSDTHLTPTSLHTGNTAASVTSSAKAIIWSAANSYGGGCFICSSPYTEVARMIGESTSPNLYDLRFHGLFPIRALGDPQNGILLCPNCHYVLSRNSRPDVVILPKDLQWFLEFEERDFAYRKQVWMAKKKAVVRTVPSAELYRVRCQAQAISGQVESGDSCDYGGLYDAYYIRDYHGAVPHLRPPGVQLRTGTGRTPKGWVSKQWHGAPALCILGAGRAIGDCEATQGVFLKLNELLGMWGREPWTENDEMGKVDDGDQGGAGCMRALEEVLAMWPEEHFSGPDSTSEDKVRWIRDIWKLYS
ncbi:hypothetical protein L211DRAFT_853531 [Terfezia boudieri ATCC MYA-4762]|uniref:HNH nuclease domain-containing protein n=1 Tax=Terfezia boudieri ATCC MYA-4762 TaxID=1051890 RepID=A0A3N4LC76_9PEZI|nr:hypothetical protein L211DRAFT_853531 [Terfezia boudieri ATCC MYA-4762]